MARRAERSSTAEGIARRVDVPLAGCRRGIIVGSGELVERRQRLLELVAQLGRRVETGEVVAVLPCHVGSDRGLLLGGTVRIHSSRRYSVGGRLQRAVARRRRTPLEIRERSPAILTTAVAATRRRCNQESAGDQGHKPSVPSPLPRHNPGSLPARRGRYAQRRPDPFRPPTGAGEPVWHAGSVASDALDAVVIGSGPNGLTAAVTLARAGLGVRVYEAADYIGGAAHTEELTLPGFRHDVGSAVHPLGVGSPAFKVLGLEQHGLEWIQGDIAMAHPLPDGTAATLMRSVEETMASLDGGGRRYRRFVKPFLGRWDDLAEDFLRPVLASFPRHPVLLARFGMRAVLPMTVLARDLVTTCERPDRRHGRSLRHAHAHTDHDRGRSRLRGRGPRSRLADPSGWIASGERRARRCAAGPRRGDRHRSRGENARRAAAGARLSLRHLAGRAVRHRRRPPPASLPAPPRSLQVRALGLQDRLRPQRAHPLESRGVPARAALHVCGTYEEIADAVTAVANGRPAEKPLLVAAQPSIVDPSRAPDGKHTFWAYAHVPNGWSGDLTDVVDDQVERFAPGFRDVVLARSTLRPADLEARNANLVGGDYACGQMRGLQSLFRPTISRVPYATPDPSIFLCSQATPPGPGVHGMCGWHAAKVVLKRVFGMSSPAPME